MNMSPEVAHAVWGIVGVLASILLALLVCLILAFHEVGKIADAENQYLHDENPGSPY